MQHLLASARTLLRSVFVCALAAPVATAQLNTTVGPSIVPMGGQLSVTFSNDNPHLWGVSLSYLRVIDASNQPVYTDTTFELAATMGPNGWISFYWDLVDNGGQPLPPGVYTAFVKSDFGVAETKHRFTIVQVGAGLVFEGTATIHPPFGGGSGRNFYLMSPSDPGAIYYLVAAFTNTTGYATCGGTLPLDPDALFIQSLTPGAVFSDSFGVLDAQGRSMSPRFPLPQNAAFVGIQLRAAFAVLDPLQPCIVTRISNAHALQIVG